VNLKTMHFSFLLILPDLKKQYFASWRSFFCITQIQSITVYKMNENLAASQDLVKSSDRKEAPSQQQSEREELVFPRYQTFLADMLGAELRKVLELEGPVVPLSTSGQCFLFKATSQQDGEIVLKTPNVSLEFFRDKTPEQREKDILHEFQLLRRAYDGKASVPRPLDFIEPLEKSGPAICVMSLVDGTPAGSFDELNDTQWKSFGQALASLHRVKNDGYQWGGWGGGQEKVHDTFSLVNKYGPLWAIDNLKAYGVITAVQKRTLSEAAGRLMDLTHAPTLNQFDLNPGNVLFSADGTKCTIIDFGLGGWLPGPYGDFASLMVDRVTRGEKGVTVPESFLSGYGLSSAEFNEKHLPLVEAAALWRAAHHLSWFLKDKNEPASGRMLSYVRSNFLSSADLAL